MASIIQALMLEQNVPGVTTGDVFCRTVIKKLPGCCVRRKPETGIPDTTHQLELWLAILLRFSNPSIRQLSP
jgi:hypothetical protein